MNSRRVYRPNTKSLDERAKERALRDRLQRDKPSLEDLIHAGEADAESVMTVGMYFDIQVALQALKKERKQSGLSIADVSERSGLDRAVISRLENGKQENPTVVTLMRYAAAVGKRFLWSFDDLATNGAGRNGKSPGRSKQRK